MGMALAEPEADPAAAAKAILQFCGQESAKPLLLLGGVYNRKLVTAMDIEVRRRAGSLPSCHAASFVALCMPPGSSSMPLAAAHAAGRGSDACRRPTRLDAG